MSKKTPFRRNMRLGNASKMVPQCTLVQMMCNDYLVPETGAPLKFQQHQLRILNHVFTPLNGKLRYNTVVYSCPKKSGKTEVGAAVMYAWAKTYGGDVYSIANDLTQAQERAYSRVEVSLRTMKEKDPERFALEVQKDYQKTITKRNKEGSHQILLQNGARMLAIPCDPYGEAGGMQTFTLWDELWGFRSEQAYRLWTEMQPLPPGVGGVQESIRFIVTYAGWYGESELLWALYDTVVKPDEKDEPQGSRVKGLEDLPCFEKGKTFVYWDHEARMPWHTAEFMEAARDDPAVQGRESEYRRIWQNRWTTGLESFIDMEIVDRIMKTNTGMRNRMEGF